MRELLQQIIAELKGSWRFRWVAMASAWLICVLGWIVVHSLPNTFESEATVYVDTSSALKPLLEQLTVDSNVLGRVELVTEAMLGRPLLERVARETDIHLRADTNEQFERLITEMRKRIVIQNDERRDPNLYKIRYRDIDRKAAQDVVASMLSIFVEDTLGANRFDTVKAQEFLRDELQKLQSELELSEAQLADFKKRNVGRMPGAGGDYFERMQGIVDELDEVQSSLRIARRKRDALRRQLSGEQPTLDSSIGTGSELDQRIAENQSRLEELELRFTEQHPDVISVKRTLEQLNRQRQEQLDEIRDGDGSGVASDNPVFQNIQIELTNVSVEIETLLEQESVLQRRVRELRELIDILPQVEAELARLTRNYDVKETQYQSLLQRLEIAELSESAEESEDVQFRIIDPPIFPEQPVAPNRGLLVFVVLIAGLGVGGGLAFFLNQLRPVFNDVVSLRTKTGLPILGTVSVMRTLERKRLRVRQVACFSIGLVALFGTCIGFIVLQEPAVEMIRSLTSNGVRL